MAYPNRFKGLKYVNVNALRTSFLIGCLVNILLAAVFLSMIGLVFLFTTSSDASQPQPIALEDRPYSTVVFLSTVPPPPSVTPLPILPTRPTLTPWPTLVPQPTFTPWPTNTPFPTVTPFTFTIVFSQPLATPTRLYSGGELLAGAPKPVLISEYKYAFYRAVCLSGLPRIEPVVIGLPEVVPGLHWRLFNDFGWWADSAGDEIPYSDDTTFFLSSSESRYHLALYYYDQRISDEVLIDYPGDCVGVEVIYLPASRAAPGSIILPDGSISQTQVISVAILQ